MSENNTPKNDSTKQNQDIVCLEGFGCRMNARITKFRQSKKRKKTTNPIFTKYFLDEQQIRS